MIPYFSEIGRKHKNNTIDEHRPGRPKKMTTNEKVGKIHHIVLDHPKLKIQEFIKPYKY